MSLRDLSGVQRNPEYMPLTSSSEAKATSRWGFLSSVSETINRLAKSCFEALASCFRSTPKTTWNSPGADVVILLDDPGSESSVSDMSDSEGSVSDMDEDETESVTSSGGDSDVELAEMAEQVEEATRAKTARAILNSEPLSSGAVESYFRHLQNEHPNFTFLNELLFVDQEKSVEEVKQAVDQAEGDKVYVPMLLEKYCKDVPLINRCFIDHIVMMVIDKEKNVVTYYDSQGNAIDSHRRSVRGLEEVVNPSELADRLSPGCKVESNKVRHQGMLDFTSCGAHVCDFVEKSLEGMTLADYEGPKDIKAVRERIVDVINPIKDDYIEV